ncbi:MAG: protease inhibitor I42 family protein, partial [Syntrophales bacterium LBB04]|nr:protease inhibitor I42 family protein [Syntrophales bacterium LBB04]
WILNNGFESDVIVQEGKEKYTPEKTERVGAGGIATFTFKAVGTGRTGLLLEYRRTWEKDTKPADDFELTVSVKKKKSK